MKTILSILILNGFLRLIDKSLCHHGPAYVMHALNIVRGLGL